MATPPMTRELLGGYLNCKYLAHLRLNGNRGTISDYEHMRHETALEQSLAATEKLIARYRAKGIQTDVALTLDILREGTAFILNAYLQDNVFDLRFDGLKKVEGRSDLGEFHYIPMLFSGARKVHKNERLLLEALGVVLGRLQGRAPARGVVCHGASYTTTSVPFTAGLRAGEDILHDLLRIQRGSVQPKLLLNDHCQVCEFRTRCRDQALKEDNLTLLRGVGQQELKRFARRGLFTITQLSHTFRPRRRGKRDRPSRVRHYALQALAIRDKIIYVFGTPEISSSAKEIYLDFEGKPDGQFVYLIGVVVCEDNREERYSYWADSKPEEDVIFDRLLQLLSKHEDGRIYCYGRYEKTFFKRMRQRARRKKAIDTVLDRLVNVLSIVYAHFYFPTYSNRLKEIGDVLGCSWSDENASGIQSIVWRARWEKTGEERWKAKLLQYNLEDCYALQRVVQFLHSACSGEASSLDRVAINGDSLPRLVPVQELDNTSYTASRFKFSNPDLSFISKRAHFDYQRQRVSARQSPARVKRRRRRHENRNRTVRPNKTVHFTASRCPSCSSSDLVLITKPRQSMGAITRVKRSFDLRISRAGVRRQIIRCRAAMYQCRQCNCFFAPVSYRRLARFSHSVMSWVIYHQVAHRISMRALEEMFYDFFGITLNPPEMVVFRTLMARYYRPMYRKLLRKLVCGSVLHADETEVILKKGKGYVWVFASASEVVYLYRPDRQGDFLQELLKDFRGVLVSDFYAPYDALNCPQQKCLIHLIRDMNQDVLSYPFDSEVQSITERFGVLLRAIVATIDERGLKRRHLRRHSTAILNFFEHVAAQSFSSDPARALQNRLIKNREKLFTFIEHDNVPWNNSNAEHAIRGFAYYREDVAGLIKEQGLREYLVLRSVYQTCRYRNISFLKFLLSKERDVDAFAARKGAKRRPKGVELYPRGFEPPHWANVRRRNALRVASRSKQVMKEEAE